MKKFSITEHEGSLLSAQKPTNRLCPLADKSCLCLRGGPNDECDHKHSGSTKE
jgi:hypothetical protein